jgi:hypothetical protein
MTRHRPLLNHFSKVISDLVGQTCQFATIPGRESPPFRKSLLAARPLTPSARGRCLVIHVISAIIISNLLQMPQVKIAARRQQKITAGQRARRLVYLQISLQLTELNEV